MTKGRADAFKWWIPTTLLVLTVIAYVWSSATRFQVIDSRSLENAKDIGEYKDRTDDRLLRIEQKIDVLLLKSQ